MRRCASYLAWSALVLLAVIALSAGGAHLFLRTQAGEKLLLEFLNSQIPGRIAYGQASVSLLGGSVELQNGVLLGPDGKEIVRAERLGITIDLFSLLQKRIVLPSVRAVRPRLNLIRFRDGRFNIVEAVVKEEEPEEEGFEVVLEGFEARDGLIGFYDLHDSLRVSLRGVGLTGGFDFEAVEGAASAEVGQARIVLDGTPVDLHTATMKASLREGLLDQVLVEVSRGGYRASVSGSIRDLFTRPVFDLSLDSGGRIEDLASLLGPGRRFSGEAEIRATIKGLITNPDLTAQVRYAGGTVAGVPVGKAGVSLRLADRVVSLEEAEAGLGKGSLALMGRVDLRKAFPGGFFQPGADLDAASYELTAAASQIDPETLFAVPKGLPRNVSGTAAYAGRGFNPRSMTGRGTCELRLAGLPGDLPVAVRRITLKVRADLAYPGLKLDGSAVADSGASLDAQGTINLAARDARLDMNLLVPRMEAFLRKPEERITGAFEARAHVSGPLQRPRIAASVQGRGVGWKGYRLDRVSADTLLDEQGVLHIERLAAAAGEPVLEAHGRIKLFGPGFTPDRAMPLSIDARIHAQDLKQLADREGVTGTLEGNIRLGGSLFDPAGTLALQCRGVSFREVSFGDIDLEGAMSHGVLSMSRIDLANKGSVIRGAARISMYDPRKRRIEPDPRVELALSGNTIELGDFTPLAQGKASFHAEIRGSLGDPRGSLRADVLKLSVSGQEVESVSLSAFLADRKLTIEPFEMIVRPGQKVTGNGWVGLDKARSYSLQVSSRGIDLREFPLLRKYQVTSGNAVFEVSGQGRLDHPRLTGNVFITSLSVSNEPIKDVFIHLSMEDWKFSMLGESNFGFNGTYDARTSDLSLKAIFKSTELQPYFRIAGRPELHGVVTGDALLKGNARKIRDADLSLKVSSIDISLQQDRILSAGDVTISYHDRRLFIPRTRVVLLEQGTMVVQASTDPAGNISLTSRGQIPLEIASVLEPDLADLMGMVRFGLTLEGPITGPRISGDIYLDDVQYLVPYNDQMITGLNGRIRFERDQAFLEDLRGRLDTGFFTLSGRVGLKDFIPAEVDLKATARSLPFTVPDTMSLVLDMSATLRGTPDSTLLAGNAVILEGSYYKDVRLDLIAEVGQRITGGGREAGAPSGPVDLPFLRNMDLDLTVSRRGTVTIENNLADATINPDLQITGTLNDPVVTGRVSVIQGTFTYQRRSFDITKGVVDFSNPYRTEAEVDVSAQGKIRDWTIYLAVSGPLENLNIELTSDPAADNATILSLLATGKTPEELTGGTGTATKSPSGMLADVLAGTYGEQVKETTGIDILQFESGTLLSGSQGQDIRITVGEKLTRRLTVKYSIETSENVLTRTTIAEYMLLENILLNGFQNSKGTFGGDVQFRLEFR